MQSDTMDQAQNNNLKVSGMIFVLANLLAGVLHYFFQVKASTDLSLREFSTFNAWLADVSVLFMIGTVLQYSSNFFPARQSALRTWLLLLNLIALFLLFLWIIFPDSGNLFRSFLVVASASVFSWSIGQIQIRMLFKIMAIAGLATAVFKLGITYLPFFQTEPKDKFQFALLASYLPALWLITIATFTTQESRILNTTTNSLKNWAAPAILAFSGALIQQIDIVVLARTQDAQVFDQFARASLYYKALYFPAFFVSQWVLPQQISSPRSGEAKIPLFSTILKVISLALLGSAVIAWVSPSISTFALNWQSSPPRMMVFLSCFNICLLIYLFFLIQDACAKKDIKRAAIAGGTLAIQALVQISLSLPLVGYYLLSLSLHLLLIIWMSASFSKIKRPSRELV